MADLFSVRQIRELEQRAIKQTHIAETELMARAGAAAFATLQQYWPRAKSIGVLCGGGNNAGDAYVLARLAHVAGLQVNIYTLADPMRLSGAALWAAKQCQQIIPSEPYTSETTFTADVFVDGLLGIGLQGELRPEYAALIHHINASKIPVLALDIPSGLHADTGYVENTAIKASVTLTFIGIKLGLVTADGPSVCGTLLCDSLGVKTNDIPAHAQSLDWQTLRTLLPTRERSAHKGKFGHVLIVGGYHGMAGAARLAGEAALRAGAGLVSVFTLAEHVNVVSGTRPELMCHSEQLSALIEKASVIAIGPGLDQNTWSQECWQTVLKTDKPLIVDADALNLLAQQPVSKKNWILTPHPGEASRLLQREDIQKNRYQAVHDLQHTFGGTVILKGAGSLITTTQRETYVCLTGNPGMATAGMGDALTGILASLVAQHISLNDSAKLAVAWHARAGDRAAKRQGEVGLLALDLIDTLTHVL